MTFLGADTDQLRTHGERCTTAAGRLGELASSLPATVHGVRWAGPGGILGDIGGRSVWENPGPWQRDDNGQLKPVPGDDRIPGVEDIDWTPRGPWMQNEDGSLKPVPGR